MIGGLRYQGFGGANSNMSFPLARLTLNSAGAKLTPRGPLRRVFPEVTLSLDDVAAIEVGWGITRTGIRFAAQTTDAIVFWARKRDREAIVAALEEAGFPTPRFKRAG